MKETFKNFIAMVVATTIWLLGFLIPVAGYYLIESGPVTEEVIFLVIVSVLFVIGVYLSKRSERIRTALGFSLFPDY